MLEKLRPASRKIKAFMEKYAIIAAFLAYLLIDLVLHGVAALLNLLPNLLPLKFLSQAILIAIPIAIVFLFGFRGAFQRKNFFRGLLCGMPYIVYYSIVMALLLAHNLKKPDVSLQSWDLILYGLFSILCVGIREECIYRATVQNIVAKKYANSVKGIWITAVVGAFIFGIMHAGNFFTTTTNPASIVVQIVSAMFSGLVFSAIYLRSGSLWAVILIHTLIDAAGLVPFTFLGVTLDASLNQITWDWSRLITWAIEVGVTAFLLRPSKCKQICESLCFADQKTEDAKETRA
jgi:membrane protease YdiL (CAAX protease family)